ncbi:putative deoxyribonuclease TATDN2 isoform X1 [Mauremys reevesii]|uniref:putative deoxyribonuclease TATDN2 isoform X1 n=1 Tax=Mauremys reevesii TaxID=260615 RepID=UPI00193EE436|nr:putative deoxyribonuclease TATDN2 isoform X1 [Mauremys reevesii]
MEPARRRRAKRAWDSWSGGSPAKYRKCALEGPPCPSSRPGSATGCPAHSAEAGSAGQPAAGGRARSWLSPQPVCQGLSAGETPRAALSARGSSPDAADGSSSSLDERGSGSSLPRRTLLRKHPGWDISKADMVSMPRKSLNRELYKSKGGAGCNLTPRTEGKGVSEEQTGDHRKKRMKDQGSTVIYLKALQDAFGKSLGKKVRKEASTSNGDQDQSPCHSKEPCKSDGNSRSICAVSGREDDQRPQLDSDRKKTSVDENNACASSVSTGQSNPKEQYVDYQRLDISGPSPKLVFVDEHNSSSEEDYEFQERDALEKDPSVGSDWSDVDDVESLARFSQEDSVPHHNRSVILETSPVITDYVMYPAHLYNRPWGDFAKCCTSSPKPPNRSFSNPSEDTTYLGGSSSSHLCDISVEFAACTPSNTSKDLESAVEGGHWRSHSFESSLVSEEKCKISSKEAESYAPIISRARMSDSFTSEYVNQEATIKLPKHLQEGFIDTHCHLDMLYSKMSFRGTFAKFRKVYNSSFPKEFQGCIADFCDPRTLKDFLWEDLLKEEMVWGAFGCHPHFARYYTDLHERDLLQALRHPKAIAFGEMGLDYSYKCSTDISKQHKVFEKQLQLAVSLRKPLVIHCREADDDLLGIMKKFVPKDYKIHRHCFTGSYDVIEPLLEHFPNLSVGFTALLTYSSAFEARETIRKIPLNRIIVETDAPYFLPRQVPKSICQYSHPGLALHTVREIARLKDLPLSRTLAVLRQNTNHVYDL